MKPDIKQIKSMIKQIENAKNAHPDWTIRDYEKEDPGTLRIIKEHTPEVYRRMFNSYYKTNNN